MNSSTKFLLFALELLTLTFRTVARPYLRYQRWAVEIADSTDSDSTETHDDDHTITHFVSWVTFLLVILIFGFILAFLYYFRDAIRAMIDLFSLYRPRANVPVVNVERPAEVNTRATEPGLAVDQSLCNEGVNVSHTVQREQDDVTFLVYIMSKALSTNVPLGSRSFSSLEMD